MQPRSSDGASFLPPTMLVVLTFDEARRIAVNLSKLPELLGGELRRACRQREIVSALPPKADIDGKGQHVRQ